MIECLFTNLVVVGWYPVAVLKIVISNVEISFSFGPLLMQNSPLSYPDNLPSGKIAPRLRLRFGLGLGFGAIFLRGNYRRTNLETLLI